jgi:hypothetical protein
MCCFSRPVRFVAKTNIFARPMSGAMQALVYGMTLSADEALAMILPIPVPKGAKDDAVRFVSLEGYPDFFEHVRHGFPEEFEALMRGGIAQQSRAMPKTLEVHQVGAFEASFVPKTKDFSRLDARFRLPEGVLDGLPAYEDYGFAVFQLRDFGVPPGGLLSRIFGRGKPRTETVHPMAFEFPRRDPSVLFFPTLHVHDGAVHETAHFDHTLYAQADAALEGWHVSSGVAKAFVDLGRAKGLVDGDGRVYRKTLVGDLKNEDTLVSIAAPRAA